MSMKLPLWLRFFLLVGVVAFAAGAGLLAYRYYSRPVTLTVAVGSLDGEAAKAMSAIAGEFVSANAPVRLKVIDSGTALEAAAAFLRGQGRSRCGSRRCRRLVAGASRRRRQPYGRTDHRAAGIVHRQHCQPEGTHGRRGRRSSERQNCRCVDQRIRSGGRKVVFKNPALTDVRQAIQSKQVGALLVVIPLAEKYPLARTRIFSA